MSTIIIGVLCIVLFLVIMYMGIPIPYAMMIGGFVGMAIIVGPKSAATLMATDLLSTFSNYNYAAIPMFAVMGYIAFYAGVGENLFGCVNSFVGHFRGGLAMATTGACAIFGAICGSQSACIGTMCAISYPEMRKRGYSPSLAGPTIAAGATLSILIPPSSNLILYGLLTENSVGRLFMAGIIPGIMMTLLFCAAIKYLTICNPEWGPSAEKSSWAGRWKAIKESNLIVIAIVFIVSMGGIFAGIFTASEGGAVGAFMMLVVTAVTRKMSFKKIAKCLISSIRLMAMIYMIMACAIVLGHMFTVSGISGALTNLVLSLDVPRWGIFAAILVIFFVLGMFTDVLGTTLVTVPLFYPILTGLGYDGVWFGIIMMLSNCIGGLTPPVGQQIFVTRGCVTWDKQATLSQLYKGIWPFVVACIVGIVVMTVFPDIVTFLPNLIYGT